MACYSRSMQEKIQTLLKDYQADSNAIALVKTTDILLLVGISGAGKDTVKQHLLERGGYHHIVSHTTRPPRSNHGILERDGKDYHFVTLDQAAAMIEDHAFIEAKLYSGNVYGTSVSEIQIAHDARDVATTDIEVQGVLEYKQISDAVTAVFLLPPSYEIWQQRLRQRYENHAIDQKDMDKRMRTAADEVKHALDTNYFHFVINDILDETVSLVDRIAHNADTVRREHKAEALARNLLNELKV